ncbi:hypothetical protein FYK55_06440 [Roseiconus nitratireducens]|uniref:Methane monooxygenase PmoA-like n=1 Tax=Roseiconus nitratireducens TaxID=2605748 RepID=A0A5M6DG58_9BACT|nr:DUF6807 family protein [Roseiconus nitratireducens]KAA5545290.1 hypothetical protein FYK55_06440 [Roseiconus nitratireducens]
MHHGDIPARTFHPFTVLITLLWLWVHLLVGAEGLAQTTDAVPGNAEANAAGAAVDSPGFQIDRTAEHLTVRFGESPVLRYNIVPPPAPDQAREIYERSGYIHPIFTPAGKLLTGDFAADHPHQHGLFAAWTQTTFRGKTVDFWNQQKGSGIVLHDRVISTDSQPDQAQFQVAVRHCALDKEGSSTPILDDVWTVRVGADVREGQATEYRIEFSIAQTNVTEAPLQIEEYHYGGIGFRGNNDWYSEAGAKALTKFARSERADPRPPLSVTRHRFLTSEGADRFGGNHTRPEWTELFGLVGDGLAAVRVSGSPDNADHPHPVRLHPTKPYFSISPCYLGAFQIAPGETYRASYQFVVTDRPEGSDRP